jgi:hypothetical protein
MASHFLPHSLLLKNGVFAVLEPALNLYFFEAGLVFHFFFFAGVNFFLNLSFSQLIKMIE